jgi:hypothetical protein
MHVQLAAIFFAAALICSLIGRILLLGPALKVSRLWGAIVLLVPFGPLAFGFTFGEPAQPTRYWRMVMGPLMLLFFATGGSVASVRSVTSLYMPSNAPTDGISFELPVPTKLVAGLLGRKVPEAPATAPAAPAAAPAVAAATPAPKSTPALAKATPAPKTTPSPAVKAALASMPPAPKIQDLTERMEANRKEFQRLSDWYDSLKHERGYLRKGDVDAVEAYNAAAAKYQTALQLAKTEEAELNKLMAKK